MERVLRFLVSRKSLVGFALAGAGLALHLTGLLPMGPFWLTVVVALYVIGAVVTPKERGPEVKVNAAADNAAIRDDLDVTRQFRVRGTTIAPYLSIVNAYNVKNVFLYVFDYSKAPPTRQAISQFPFLPSAGVTIQF